MTAPEPPTLEFGYSEAFDQALGVATVVHRDQTRKGTCVPYVMHPFHVAMIVERHGFGEHFRVAAVLHDVLEDVRVDREASRDALRAAFPGGLADAPEDPRAFVAHLDGFLEREFGNAVMTLVRGVTDVLEADGRRLSTLEKRRRKLAELRDPATSPDIVALKAADAIHNARSTARDLRAYGPVVMERFKTGPVETLQWYTNVRDAADERLSGRHPALVAELTDAVRSLAGELVRLELELKDVTRFLTA